MIYLSIPLLAKSIVRFTGTISFGFAVDRAVYRDRVSWGFVMAVIIYRDRLN